jgi:hypothetical protein
MVERTLILLMAALVCCCSSASQQGQEPASTPGPDTLATLTAIGPSIEFAFDGHTCTTSGSTTLAPGVHVITLVSTSGENAYLGVGRNNAGHTWQDVVKEIGTPPSTDLTARGVAIVRADTTVFGDEVDYRQFTFDIEGEYNITVQGHGQHYGR